MKQNSYLVRLKKYTQLIRVKGRGPKYGVSEMYRDDVKKVVCINHVALLVKKLTQFEYNTLQGMSDSLMFCSGDIEVVCFPEINLPAFNRIAGTKESNSDILYCFTPLDEVSTEPPRERDPEHDFVQGLYRLVGTGIAR